LAHPADSAVKVFPPPAGIEEKTKRGQSDKACRVHVQPSRLDQQPQEARLDDLQEVRSAAEVAIGRLVVIRLS
jgi:hypothetical protein